MGLQTPYIDNWPRNYEWGFLNKEQHSYIKGSIFILFSPYCLTCRSHHKYLHVVLISDLEEQYSFIEASFQIPDDLQLMSLSSDLPQWSAHTKYICWTVLVCAVGVSELFTKIWVDTFYQMWKDEDKTAAIAVVSNLLVIE